MKISLLFIQNLSVISGFLHLQGRFKTLVTVVLIAMMGLISNVYAQTSQTVPDSNVSGTFLGPLANAARTYQMLIDDSQVASLSGKYLTSISFRLSASASASWPPVDATYGSYEIYLSNGVDPANRQLNFSANIVGTQTMVKSGSLVIPAGSLTAGSDPNAFSYALMFDTPYLYNGGNLIIEIRHLGSNTTSTSTHSVTSTNTGAGYGTLFSACWQGTGNVTNGNFSYVKINSADTLGVKSVTLDDGLSVYPNPVTDNLYVKSATEITELNIYNFAGQKLMTQKNSVPTPQLNVTSLPKGVYILQMLDKKGNITSTRFVKQ